MNHERYAAYIRIGDSRADGNIISFFRYWAVVQAEISLLSYESKYELFVRLLYFCSGRKIIECPAIANAWPLAVIIKVPTTYKLLYIDRNSEKIIRQKFV